MVKHHHEMLSSDNLRVRSILFEATTSVVNIGDTIATNDDLQRLLAGSFKTQEEAYESLNKYSQMKDIYGQYTEVSSITLFTTNKTLESYGHIKRVDETTLNQTWYQEAVQKIGYNWMIIEKTNDFGAVTRELSLTYAVPVFLRRSKDLLVITVSNNYLKNRIDNNKLKVDITVEDQPIFFSNWGKSGLPLDFSIDYDQVYFKHSGFTDYFNQAGLVEISTFKPYKGQERIYISSTDLSARQSINRILVITSMIVILSIVVPFYVILKFTRKFVYRVDTLRTQMHRVTEGDYHIIETFKGADELTDLFLDLKVMIHSINQRDKEIYSSKIKEQKLINHQQMMEMEILSSKINPHFLYNTLETIRMKAFNADNIEVANAVKLLGKYMRHNLESSGKFTNLATELDFIKIYLDIQKLRFGSKIDYQITLDEVIKAEGYPILPLLIQPVVENAILHGLEDKIEGGFVHINIKSVDDFLVIEVADNGCGMDEVKLEQMKQQLAYQATQEQSHPKGSIGLYNVNQRIKLHYGHQCGLYINSSVDKGTIVQLRLLLNGR